MKSFTCEIAMGQCHFDLFMKQCFECSVSLTGRTQNIVVRIAFFIFRFKLGSTKLVTRKAKEGQCKHGTSIRTLGEWTPFQYKSENLEDSSKHNISISTNWRCTVLTILLSEWIEMESTHRDLVSESITLLDLSEATLALGINERLEKLLAFLCKCYNAD